MVAVNPQYLASKIARSRTVRRTRTLARRPDLLGRTYAPRLYERYLGDPNIDAQLEEFLHDQLNALGQSGAGDPGTVGNLIHLYRRAKAIQTSWFIALAYLPLQWFMVLLSLTSLAGIAMDSLFLVSYLLPGQTVFSLAYLAAAFIGTLSMMVAAIVYKIRFVDCFGDFKIVIFAACLTLYWMPVLAIIPWLWVWCISVALMQPRNTQLDE